MTGRRVGVLSPAGGGGRVVPGAVVPGPVSASARDNTVGWPGARQWLGRVAGKGGRLRGVGGLPEG